MLHCSIMLLWSLTIVFAAKSHLEILYDKLSVADEKHKIEISNFLRSSFTVYKFYSNFFDQHAFYFYDQITQSNFYTDDIFTTIKFNSHWRTYVIGHDEDGMREQLIQALHQKVMTDTPYLEIEDIHRFVIQEHDTNALAEECALLERNFDSFFTDPVAQELQTLARTDCVTITINCKVTKDSFCLIKNILSHISEKGETGMYITNQIYIDVRNSKDLECYLKRLQSQLDGVKKQEILFNSRLMHYTANIISKQSESESVNSLEFKLVSDHAKKHYKITKKCSYNIYKSNMTQQRRDQSDFDRNSSVTTLIQNNVTMPKITANFAYLLSLYNFDAVNHFKVTINIAAKVQCTFTFNFLELISNSIESRSKVFVQGTYTEEKRHKDLGVSNITDKITSNTFKNTCLYFLYDLDLLKLKQKNMLTTDYLVKNELPNQFLYFNSFHKKFELQLSLESLSSSVKKYICDSDTRYQVTAFVHDHKYTYQTDTQVQSNFTNFHDAKEFLNLRSYGSTPLLDIILYEHKNHEQDKVGYPRLAHNDAIFYNKNDAIYVKEDFGSYGTIYHIIYENRNNANKHWLNFYDINLFFLLYNDQALRNELTLCIGNIQNLEYIDILSFYFEILGNIQFIYKHKPFAEFLMTKIAHTNKLCLVKAYKICKNNQPLSTSNIDSYVLSLTIAKYLKDKFVIFINHIDQYFLQHNNNYKYGIRSYSVGNIEYETLMCASNNVRAHIESETRS